MKVNWVRGLVVLSKDDGTESVGMTSEDYFRFLGRVFSGNFIPYTDTDHPGLVYIRPYRENPRVDSQTEGFFIREDEWVRFRGTPREDLEVGPFPPDIPSNTPLPNAQRFV